MISKPILTKEIKLNKQVYNLELWNPASDNIFDDYEVTTHSKKDFFDNTPTSESRSVRQSSDSYQEHFDDWFDKLPSADQRKYADAIDESNKVIIGIVWDLLLQQDQEELFNNNVRSFNKWFSELDVTDIDFYMTRIMSKQRVLPKNLITNEEVLSEEEISIILGEVYDKIDDDLIRATTINGLLCISCTDESRLQKAKQHMVRHGSILRDFRKKQNAHGNVIYTYIFSRP
jgi:hypothetical protein